MPIATRLLWRHAVGGVANCDKLNKVLSVPSYSYMYTAPTVLGIKVEQIKANVFLFNVFKPRQSLFFCVSVCVTASYRQPCSNGWRDRDVVWHGGRSKPRPELRVKLYQGLDGSGCRGGFKGWPPPPWELCPPCPLMKLVARLHNTCIYSVASHSWCQITPFTQSCINMSSRILAPPPKKNTDLATHGHPKLLQLEMPV